MASRRTCAFGVVIRTKCVHSFGSLLLLDKSYDRVEDEHRKDDSGVHVMGQNQ